MKAALDRDRLNPGAGWLGSVEEAHVLNVIPPLLHLASQPHTGLGHEEGLP